MTFKARSNLRLGARNLPGTLARLIGGFALAITCCSLLAEETVPSSGAGNDNTLGNFSLYTYGGPFRFSLSPETSNNHPWERFQLVQNWQFDSIFQSHSGETPVDDESPLMLFRKQLSTHYSYHKWAGLGTGYGQFLSTNALGRSRTNGVGIQEQDWFYLKMSFKF